MDQKVLISIVVVLVIVLLGIVFRKRRSSKILKEAQIRPQVTTVSKSTIEKPLTDFDRVQLGLKKSRGFFKENFSKFFSAQPDSKFYDEVEEALLTADVGIDYSDKVIQALKNNINKEKSFKDNLVEIIQMLLPKDYSFTQTEKPHVIMIIGVNGAGKTTTIAKLCSRFISQNKKVIVGAADTFRAAATEQLKTWVERVGAEGVFQAEGSDPSAVAFDTINAAKARGSDICIIDTAGRLHTKSNLMDELQKMKRVVAKAMPGAPHDVWLVLDGTMGQNALNQAQEFHKSLGVTGLIITKLDSSAKGGALLSISSELALPVSFIGVGESPEDLIPFTSKEFVGSLLSDLH